MDLLSWITVSLFLTTTMSSAAAAQNLAFFLDRAGDDVTLPCTDASQGHRDCGDTTWSSGPSIIKQVNWFKGGSFTQEAKIKSGRLSVTADCSLVIKKVTPEDAGRYRCRRTISGKQEDQFVVDLSVLTMTEQRNNDKVIISCSVSKQNPCRHSVEWTFDGDKQPSDIETSKNSCSATVTFPTRLLHQDPEFYESLKCKIIDDNNFQLKVPLRCQSSDSLFVLRCILVSAGLAALIMSVVTVNIWTQTGGFKTQKDQKARHGDDDDEDVVYENTKEPSASVRIH